MAWSRNAGGEPQRASKGSPGSRGPDRSHPLSFSLRLGWHPYLKERAVHPATAAWFGVGYYAGCGFLRNRIVFPIHDPEGQLVRMPAAASMMELRYLFPPGFPKSQVVLISIVRCWNRRAGPWWWKDSLTACGVHQAGYRNVMALLGVSLSEAQEKLLLERFPRLALMLDADEAGQRASRHLAARLRGKVSLSMVKVPERSATGPTVE